MLTKKQAEKLRQMLINKFGWIFDDSDIHGHIKFLMTLKLDDVNYNNKLIYEQGFLLERNGETYEHIEQALEVLIFDEQLKEIVK